MSITTITPRETELQKQVIQLSEGLRNLGWEFELYKQGARATHQKLLDEVAELKSKLAQAYQYHAAELADVVSERDALMAVELYNSHHASQMATPLGGTP